MFPDLRPINQRNERQNNAPFADATSPPDDRHSVNVSDEVEPDRKCLLPIESFVRGHPKRQDRASAIVRVIVEPAYGRPPQVTHTQTVINDTNHSPPWIDFQPVKQGTSDAASTNQDNITP
jgi:hypothetical protein